MGGTVVQRHKGSPMVAAVSSSVSADPTPDSTDAAPVTYVWFKMPDLNRSTHRLLGKSGAGWTFETICRLVHHVGRVGRPQAKKAARELGRLGVGLQAIADEAGISVAKVRRDLVELVDLGLVAVSRRNVTFSTDPSTGKIVENRTGRSLPVIVFLTVGPEHCRTKSGQARQAANPPKMAPANPSNLEGAGVHDRDHLGGAIQKDFNQREPDGQADGVGQPQAGKAGGHTAAKAGQEEVTVRLDAGEDDLPAPIGRISRPAGKAPKAARRGHTSFPEDHDIEVRVWQGADAARVQATLQRLEAQKAAVASDADGSGLKAGSFLDEYRKATGKRRVS